MVSEASVSATESVPSTPVDSSFPLGSPNIPKEVDKNATARGYYLATRPPISFWGRVVDDHGSPIGGATARLSVHNKIFDPGTDRNEVTNSDGLFSLTGIHGLGVTVAVSKTGYYETSRSRAVCGYFVHAATDIPIPTADNPALFVLKKSGEGAALIKTQRQTSVRGDGTPSRVDLTVGPINGATPQLSVDCLISATGLPVGGYHPYDWQCTLSIPGGALFDRFDPLSFTAPSGGYRASDKITVPKTAKNWSSRITRDYFVQISGNWFGRINVTLHADPQKPRVSVDSYLNPTPGDRNLEFDPAKQIKVP